MRRSRAYAGFCQGFGLLAVHLVDIGMFTTISYACYYRISAQHQEAEIEHLTLEASELSHLVLDIFGHCDSMPILLSDPSYSVERSVYGQRDCSRLFPQTSKWACWAHLNSVGNYGSKLLNSCSLRCPLFLLLFYSLLKVLNSGYKHNSDIATDWWLRCCVGAMLH